MATLRNPRWRVLAIVALAAAVIATAIWRRADNSPIVRTIDLDAALMAVDTQTDTLVAAGSSIRGGRVTVLDERSGSILRSVGFGGRVVAGGEFTPSSLLALDGVAHRAYVTTPGYGTGLTRHGLLTVIDVQRGTLVRTIGLPLPPAAAACGDGRG